VSANDDHARGPRDASRTLVQYGDYECPYCHRDQPGLARILDRHRDALRFIFRHYPLAAEHPNAERAARAAEAGASQDRFWEMHEALMARPAPLDHAALTACAEAAGLDLQRFSAELDDEALDRRVRRDVELAEADGIRGTPWYVLDGAVAGPLRALAEELRRPHAGESEQ
jgi:protein-disulfide isomerase